jgi:hypothetical protein
MIMFFSKFAFSNVKGFDFFRQNKHQIFTFGLQNPKLNNGMNRSTTIHSSLVNPAKPNLKENKVDHVTMDVPLLTRILELSRENIKTDADLHVLLTRLIQDQGKVLTMNDYQELSQGFDPGSEPTDKDPELESILKLAGM